MMKPYFSNLKLRLKMEKKKKSATRNNRLKVLTMLQMDVLTFSTSVKEQFLFISSPKIVVWYAYFMLVMFFCCWSPSD